jgi:hypothetical protein
METRALGEFILHGIDVLSSLAKANINDRKLLFCSGDAIDASGGDEHDYLA